MSTFTEQRRELSELIGRARSAADRVGDAAASAELDRAADELAAGRLTMVVAGEFKRGKSSLLNALIEEPELFPTDTSIATNMVTAVTYGQAERVLVELEDPAAEAGTRVEEIQRSRIREFATEQGNPGNERRTRLMTIELLNEKLKDGLTLVDTPGVGGLNADHTAVTYGYVTTADVVLYVLDVHTTLNTEELDLIGTIAEHAQAIVFVVTKVDQTADFGTVVDNTRAKVSAKLGWAADEVPVVPVSNLAKLEYLETGDAEDLEVSNFPALEAKVWHILRERGGAMILLRALGTIARALDDAIGPVKAELDAYAEQSQAQVEEAERGLEKAAARAEELRTGQAAWRKTLSRELRRVRRILVKDEFRKRSLAIRSSVDVVLDDEGMLERPDEVVALIDRDVTLMVSRLSTVLAKLGDEVTEKIAAETGLELNPAAPDVPLAAEASRPDFTSMRSVGVRGDKVISAQRGLAIGGMGGSGIATVVGILLAPAALPAFAAIGAVIGGTQGVRSQLKQLQHREHNLRRSEVAKRTRPYVEEALAHVDTWLAESLDQTEEGIADSFDQMLRDEHRRLKEAQHAIGAARKRTKEEAAERVAELREPLTTLQSLRGEADAQTQSALTAGNAPTAVAAQG